MKLLVCGGMGFIGSAFIRNHLSKNPNDQIVNLDNLTTGSNVKNLEKIDESNYQFINDDRQEILDCFRKEHKILEIKIEMLRKNKKENLKK